MTRNTKLIVFSTAILLISLTSCKPRKAIELKENIVQKERVAFNILLDKKGPESQKLEYLVKNDYKGALTSIDNEEKEFDKLIKEIEALPAEGIEQGNELKTAAMNYYTALKDLHIFDRAEISHREATAQMEGEQLQAAQHKFLELGIQKQGLYKTVYEKERAFHEAMEKFSSANNI